MVIACSVSEPAISDELCEPYLIMDNGPGIARWLVVRSVPKHGSKPVTKSLFVICHAHLLIAIMAGSGPDGKSADL